ncbi:MAG: putative membrane-anchored protein [Luteibaculaceae bacterium]|jgi:uncharacterized membrane-anchored protein
MKSGITLLLCAAVSLGSYAYTDSTEIVAREIQIQLDSLVAHLEYQTGEIVLGDGLAELHVPYGFKFLDAKQSDYVLTEVWGNPPSPTLGMLFPENETPVSDGSTFAIEISFSDEGYVEDEDAADIDYGDLLDQMIADTEEVNPQRVELGYPTIQLIGWASTPFYDAETKKLHWAKELNFGGYENNTLNYNIRILGREGYLNLNAIGEMPTLPLVQDKIDAILESVNFTEGNTYADFNPDIDKVAAYGIGGLIAGKILAKVGFFAVLVKFWKFIAIGAIGLFSVFKKKIFGSKKEDSTPEITEG